MDEQPSQPPGPPPVPGGDPGPVPFHHAEVSSETIGEAVDEGTGRIFPCDQCGADLRFHIGQQRLKCDHCGYERDIVFDEEATVEEQDFHAMLDQLREQRSETPEEPAELQASEVRCESCGGNVEFIGTLTSTECPYCASPVQLENVHKADPKRIPVDGMLPFLVERETATKNLKEWVQSRWFAPNAFRRRGVKAAFNGVYLSFFTFDSMTFTRYVGERGEYYYVTVGSGDNKRRERRTRWYDARGKFQRFFDDVLILANSGVSRKFMNRLEPWPLGKVVPFSQQMLAGHFARTYDIELDRCFEEARERIDQALHQDVISRIGGDTQRVHDIKTRYDAITFKHILLPVWLLAYRYNDKPYRVVVNACTGEVQGERPYSWVKITLAVLAAVAVVGAIVAMQS